jgi:hypothetical protein
MTLAKLEQEAITTMAYHKRHGLVTNLASLVLETKRQINGPNCRVLTGNPCLHGEIIKREGETTILRVKAEAVLEFIVQNNLSAR